MYINFFYISQLSHNSFIDIYEVWLLNNETAYEKEFYFKNYSTIECSPSIYSPRHTPFYSFFPLVKAMLEVFFCKSI